MKTLGRTLLAIVVFLGSYLAIGFMYGFVKGILGDTIITWLDMIVVIALSGATTACLIGKTK